MDAMDQNYSSVRREISTQPNSMDRGSGNGSLTPREREVLREICAGAANKEIGRKLAISPRTVEVHRARIMAKIGARNAADLVRIVLSQGIYAAARPDFGA
jgi:DNA-binding CsgD family transcriptional regulator